MLGGIFTLASELCRVRVYWEGSTGNFSDYFVTERDVPKLIEATKKLHHDPGVNPHIRDRDPKTTRVVKITVARLVCERSYWWSTPDLQRNDDPSGAVIWDFREDHALEWRPEEYEESVTTSAQTAMD